MGFELFHCRNIFHAYDRYRITGAAGKVRTDQIYMRIVKKIPSEPPLSAAHGINGGHTLCVRLPFVIRAIIMVSHYGNDTVFRLQLSQHIHKRKNLIRMRSHQVSAEYYKVRILGIYSSYYLQQDFRSVSERTEVHI